MFCNLSKDKRRKESIRVYGVPLRSNRVNFAFGRPEWQQKFATTHNHFYDLKKLTGNREILDKPYLKRDYSGFKLIHFPQKRPFLTSNARDFVPIQMKEEDKAKLTDERLHFLKSSRVTMGEYNPEDKSMYGYIFEDPKARTPRFEFDKINFKYDPYNLHPILQTPIWKDPKRMNPFDYYNKDKDKHYITNRNVSYINTEYRKVWDPITNRYFPGSLRSLSENKKN